MAVNARAGKGGPDKLGGEVLAAHNEYRSKHGAPALQWSREAAEAANRWAARLASIGKISFSEAYVLHAARPITARRQTGARP